VECIAFNPKANIDLISKETGLSYTAVRNGVLRLIELGVVEEITETRSKRRRGRPATLFRLDKGLQIILPPRQFEQLAAALIEQIVKDEGLPRVETLLKHAAQLQAQKILQEWEEQGELPSSLKAIVERIGGYMHSIGCYAKIGKNRGQYYLRIFNCVYSKVALKYPVTLCHFHYNLISSLVHGVKDGVNVTHKQSIAQGAPHCLFLIKA
jgi:predicted ArsR family transcriptional regulator